MKRQYGFTLLEVKPLAGWIADNHLGELLLQRPSPAPGRKQRDVSYAGRDWQVQEEIHSTSDATLRRVTLWVAPNNPQDNSDIQARASLVVSGFIGVHE